MPNIANDPRLDPRLKAVLSMLPSVTEETDVVSREAQLAEANTPEAKAATEQLRQMLEMMDNEDIAPSDGLEISELEFPSQPDGNPIKIRFVRPEGQRESSMRLLHPWRRDDDLLLLLRKLSGVVENHRGQWRGRSNGRFPQRVDAIFRRRRCALPSRTE